jgi:MSHA pilin protein MshD
MLNRHRRSAGVTLVELIVALVIMGVALAGVVAVYTSTTRASVDPVVVQQMQAIADNMMEEILMKPFAPLDPASDAPSYKNGGARVNYNDVNDYDGYGADNTNNPIAGIRDVEGNAITGLERYTVVVRVTSVKLTGMANPNALRVRVEVGVAGSPENLPGPIVLTGWRTDPS